MPFKSEAQRRKFYALHSEGKISSKILKEWESSTPKSIPERVKKAMEDAAAIKVEVPPEKQYRSSKKIDSLVEDLEELTKDHFNPVHIAAGSVGP